MLFGKSLRAQPTPPPLEHQQAEADGPGGPCHQQQQHQRQGERQGETGARSAGSSFQELGRTEGLSRDVEEGGSPLGRNISSYAALNGSPGGRQVAMKGPMLAVHAAQQQGDVGIGIGGFDLPFMPLDRQAAAAEHLPIPTWPAAAVVVPSAGGSFGQPHLQLHRQGDRAARFGGFQEACAAASAFTEEARGAHAIPPPDSGISGGGVGGGRRPHKRGPATDLRITPLGPEQPSNGARSGGEGSGGNDRHGNSSFSAPEPGAGGGGFRPGDREALGGGYIPNGAAILDSMAAFSAMQRYRGLGLAGQLQRSSSFRPGEGDSGWGDTPRQQNGAAQEAPAASKGVGEAFLQHLGQKGSSLPAVGGGGMWGADPRYLPADVGMLHMMAAFQQQQQQQQQSAARGSLGRGPSNLGKPPQ